MMLSFMNRYGDWALLFLRIVIAAIFLVHGFQKFGMLTGEGPLTMKILAIAEPLGGLAVLVGGLTRLASVGLGIIMLGAIYTKITVMQKGFSGGWEFDLLILAGCVVLLCMGAGRVSVDSALEKQ